MKTTIAMLLLAALAGSTWYYKGPDAPSPISVQSVTEKTIKEDVKREQREKQRIRAIRRATAAARMVFRKNGCRDIYSDLTGRTAYEYRLSGSLLAAVVFVESGCRANVVSGRNSVGLMQVNPKVWGHRKELKDPAQNLRIGASILSSYIRVYGLVEGLHHYNGYSEVHEHTYVNKVLTVAGLKIEAKG